MTDPDPNASTHEFDFGPPTVDPGGYEEEGYDFDPVDYPENPDFDSRQVEEEGASEKPNPNLLALVEQYLSDAQTKLSIRKHLPDLLRILGAKVAHRRNRFYPVHFFGPGIPFRYRVHAVMLGASGTDKGATVETFFQLLGPTDDGPPVFPTFEFNGGSLESFRGGVTQDRPNDPKLVKPGSIERTDLGFIHVAEFTQVIDLGSRFGGSFQSILGWADTGRMSYETISGKSVDYLSDSVWVVDLQPALLDDVMTAAVGWARRTVPFYFPVPTIRECLPENRPATMEGDPLQLAEIRATLLNIVKGYCPTSIDWTPFHNWLSKAYRSNLVVTQDEQMLYSMALGHHIVSGGALTGPIRIGVSDQLSKEFRALLWNKRLSRLPKARRLAFDAYEVLKDEWVLGNKQDPQTLSEYWATAIVAQRLSISEETAAEALKLVVENGAIVRDVMTKEDGSISYATVRLATTHNTGPEAANG